MSIPGYTTQSKYPHEDCETPSEQSGKPGLSNVSNLHAPPPNGAKVQLPPVVAVEIYRNDARQIRASTEQVGGGQRSEITEISAAAIKNAKFIIANSDPDLASLITVTYPETFPTDGRIVKAHFRALKERIRRKYGDYSYFAAIEYQERGAAHLHVAISIKLDELGPLNLVKRKAGNRRSPAFETHKPSNEWLFNAWVDIISKEQPNLEWYGITPEDAQKMHTAFFDCGAAVSWERMRLEDGAKRYMVKELSSLKGYQKQIPPEMDNPGRHFLYSPDMKPSPVMVLEATEGDIRAILEGIGWEFLPKADRPLFRDLWNVAADLVVSLLQGGAKVIDGDHLEAVRRFADLRCQQFTDWTKAEMQAWEAETRRLWNSWKFWNKREKIIANQIDWELANWGHLG